MAQNNEKYYQCPVCWKEFSKPHTVKIHLRVHTGEKPFQCQYCSKAFTTSGNLGDHMRVHSTARMFKCKLCGAKFKRKATLKRHYEMHAKYSREKNMQENTEIIVTGNAEEILQTEIVNQPMYFSRYEQGEEMVQTEIVNHPSHIHLDDLQDQHSPTIELLFPPVTGREDQDNLILSPVKVKEEILDDFYDATILELTEEVEDIEGVQVRVYSLPRNSSQSSKPLLRQDEDQEEEIHLPRAVNSPRSKGISSLFDVQDGSASALTELEPNLMQLDLSKKYGAYVTKMLKLIQSKDRQVELIKELNQAIHEFVIENR